MKRSFVTYIKVLLFLFLSFTITLIGHSFLDDILYDFKLIKYDNDIDALFNKNISNLYVQYKYKSGARGTIYYISIGLSKLTIIEANNFRNIVPSKLEINPTEKIKLTDGKTYSTILRSKYPIVQAVLNPRESDFIRISILKPFDIVFQEQKSNHLYLTGNFKSILFSNSQICYIVSNSNKSELLILTFKNKLYFIVGDMNNRSLLETINPEFL